MLFRGAKNPKICWKWLILAIFFFWLEGKWGKSLRLGENAPLMLPLFGSQKWRVSASCHASTTQGAWSFFKFENVGSNEAIWCTIFHHVKHWGVFIYFRTKWSKKWRGHAPQCEKSQGPLAPAPAPGSTAHAYGLHGSLGVKLWKGTEHRWQTWCRKGGLLETGVHGTLLLYGEKKIQTNCAWRIFIHSNLRVRAFSA